MFCFRRAENSTKQKHKFIVFNSSNRDFGCFFYFPNDTQIGRKTKSFFFDFME